MLRTFSYKRFESKKFPPKKHYLLGVLYNYFNKNLSLLLPYYITNTIWF